CTAPACSSRSRTRRRSSRVPRLRSVAEPSLKGKLLIAAPLLVDPNFHRTVVLVIEHSAEGALGVVLNRPTELPVADAVPELAELDDGWVFAGGPVQPQAVIALAEYAGLPPDGAHRCRVRHGCARRGGNAGAGVRRLLGLGRGPARGRARGGRLVRRAR